MPSFKWMFLLLLFYVNHTNAITVDPNVSSVVSSGPQIREGDIQCRVILKSVGFEHISTEVQLDWLALSGDSIGTVEVTHSEKIIEPGWHVVNSARFYVEKGKQYLELNGVHTYSYEKERYVFLIKPEGVVKIIKQPYQ